MIATTLKDVVSKARRDMDEVSKFVSLQNIGRYQRLLRRQLTDLEREFVERRLAEERQALKSSRNGKAIEGGARPGSAIKIAIVKRASFQASLKSHCRVLVWSSKSACWASSAPHFASSSVLRRFSGAPRPTVAFSASAVCSFANHASALPQFPYPVWLVPAE